MTHPTFEGINHFAARGAAIGVDAISIEAKGALQIISREFVLISIGPRSRLGLGSGVGDEPDRADRQQRYDKRKRTDNYARAMITAFVCRHVFTPELV